MGMDYATLHVDDRGQQTSSCLTAPVNQTCPQSGLSSLAGSQTEDRDRRKSLSLSLLLHRMIASCVCRFRHLQSPARYRGRRRGGTPLIMNRFPSFNSVGKFALTLLCECEENTQPQNVISISLQLVFPHFPQSTQQQKQKCDDPLESAASDQFTATL